MEYFEPQKIKLSKIDILFTKIFMLIKYILYKYVLRKNIKVIYPNVSFSYGKVRHSNWGDDLNMFLLPFISHDVILPGAALIDCWWQPFAWLRKYEKIKCIGSVFDTIYEDNTIVWGAGMIEKNKYPYVVPKKILAVRGPLTYAQLIKKGYECPKIFGDPVLLLPYYYKPKSANCIHKIGIIPHYTDLAKEEVKKILLADNVLLINVFQYKKWTEIIDQICSCEVIVSSSLHGLVASEAYGITNIWAEFNEPLVGNVEKRFKFHDFFQSIGLDRETPYVVTLQTTVEDLLQEAKLYKKSPGLSLRPLVEACPFKLKKTIKAIV